MELQLLTSKEAAEDYKRQLKAEETEIMAQMQPLEEKLKRVRELMGQVDGIMAKAAKKEAEDEAKREIARRAEALMKKRRRKSSSSSSSSGGSGSDSSSGPSPVDQANAEQADDGGSGAPSTQGGPLPEVGRVTAAAEASPGEGPGGIGPLAKEEQAAGQVEVEKVKEEQAAGEVRVEKVKEEQDVVAGGPKVGAERVAAAVEPGGVKDEQVRAIKLYEGPGKRKCPTDVECEACWWLAMKGAQNGKSHVSSCPRSRAYKQRVKAEQAAAKKK